MGQGAPQRRRAYETIKAQCCGRKGEQKNLEKLFNEHPEEGKAAGYQVAPRNSIRSPEATKMVFQEFEHSSPADPHGNDRYMDDDRSDSVGANETKP